MVGLVASPNTCPPTTTAITTTAITESTASTATGIESKILFRYSKFIE